MPGSWNTSPEERDEEDLDTLLVERLADRWIPADGFDIFAESRRFPALSVGEAGCQEVICPVRLLDTISRANPVDAEAELMQQFADDSRDFRRYRLFKWEQEQRAAAALVRGRK